MDLIERAERQYARISPRPAADWTGVAHREALVWLRDYVCPVVEDFIGHPKFQEIARWPLDVLSSAGLAPVAGLVAEVERGLIASAKTLLEVTKTGPIEGTIRALNPPKKRIVEEEVAISAEGCRRVHARAELVDDLAAKRAQVERIAQHRFAALVCRDDYFGPVGSIIPAEELAELRKQTDSPLTEGAMVVSLNPELHLVGDFVTRSMFRRIEIWMTCLKEYRRLVYQAVERLRRSGGSTSKAGSRASRRSMAKAPASRVPAAKDAPAWENLLADEARTWAKLEAAEAALRTACLTGGSAKARDACIILTQTYAAFHPKAELGWLGLSDQLIKQGASTLDMRRTSLRSIETLDQIAAALPALRNLQDGESRLDAAIRTGGLVIVRQPPAVYWEQKEIDAPWDSQRMSFTLLWKLAEQAKHTQGYVRDKDLWDKPGAQNRLSMAKGRLEKLLVNTSLLHKIDTTPRAGVRLDLERRRIHLLETADS